MRTALLLANHPLAISSVTLSTEVLYCNIVVRPGPKTISMLGPKWAPCFFRRPSGVFAGHFIVLEVGHIAVGRPLRSLRVRSGSLCGRDEDV